LVGAVAEPPVFSSHAYGVRFSRINQPPVARYASLTGG
jgi:hypothetical protein